MGAGFSKKKQAKALQMQFTQLQNDLKEQEIKGTAGNGLVVVTLNGNGDFKQIKIKPECVDPEDVEGLEDLIKAAFKSASDQISTEGPSLPSILSGMSIPPGGPDLKSLGF